MFLEKGSYKDKLMFLYYKCCTMTKLTFLKEWMSKKQESVIVMHQNSVMFVTIGSS